MTLFYFSTCKSNFTGQPVQKKKVGISVMFSSYKDFKSAYHGTPFEQTDMEISKCQNDVYQMAFMKLAVTFHCLVYSFSLLVVHSLIKEFLYVDVM